MKAIYLLIFQILKIYEWIVIIHVILSWLISFNILNTQNRLVYAVLDFTYRATSPILDKIKNYIPNLGQIDISPVILLLGLWFIKLCMQLYLQPLVF
ncbi:YggT family protein [Pelagibacteraceae bacterium]|jgi:YggT family protein|nr:YggT family protein [Pelagibacteraceae bacterium]|tara:strand:+ start:672 stop:962 length:291 start_codon:yes stop_codon:yes gene_type:complete